MKPGQRQIHVVPSFHYDVVYLKDFKSYQKQSFKIIDEVLSILEESSKYTFTIEQTILLEAFWEARPSKRGLLKRFASEGRLHVAPGMYVMPDMNMPDGESLFLQVVSGFKWLDEKLGLRPEVCWIADCWGHHAQIPQILNQSGYRYYAFWRCMDRGLRRNHFIWKGLDGTEMKTHWLSKGYGSICFPSDDEIINAPDLSLHGCSAERFRTLAAEMDSIGAGGIAMLCNGGDFMMPQRSAPGIIASMKKSGELPGIAFSTPKQYLDALKWKDVPVHKGEFNSAFQGCFSSNIRIKQGIRLCSTLLGTGEKLSAITGKGFPNYEKLLKKTLKQQFHDTICGTIADSALVETLRELDDTAAGLRKVLKKPFRSSKTPYFFNPLQFDRTEFIREAKGVVELTARALSCVRKSSAKRLRPSPGTLVLPCEFETPACRLRIAKDGFIESIRERENDRELLSSSLTHKFGELTMQADYGDLWLHFDSPLNGGCVESSLTQNQPDPLDRPDAAGLVNRSSFKPCIMKAEVVFCSPQVLIVRQTGTVGFWKLKSSFTSELTLYADSPRIDYRSVIFPEGRHFRLRAAFPTSITGGEANYEIPFGIQTRGPGVHAAQNWFDYSDKSGRNGIAVINKGVPGCSVDSEGNLLLNVFRSAAMEYKAESCMSFNSGVEHTFEYAIFPHGKRYFSEIVKQGLLFNHPLTEVNGDYSTFSDSNWRCPCPSVFISAIRPVSAGIFLRIYEGAGVSVKGNVSVPGHIEYYAEADGLHNAITPRKPCRGLIPFSLKPFQIKSFILKPCPQ
ncbi:MAG: glycoside hydrolase family 38 C-terminal domain-containing protein [Victivallales bacterium]